MDTITYFAHVRRASRIRWAGLLPLVGCLATSTAASGAQHLRPSDRTTSVDACEAPPIEAPARAREVALTTLIERLNAANEIATAQMTLLRHRLKDTEARLVDAQTARAQAEARLDDLARPAWAAKPDNAEMSARVAALEDQLRERDRQLERAVSWRAEADNLRQQLDAANADLARKEAANQRMAADLARLDTTAAAAAGLARAILVAIDREVRTLEAAARTVDVETAASLFDPPSVTLTEVGFAEPQAVSGSEGLGRLVAENPPAEFDGNAPPGWVDDVALADNAKLLVSDLLARLDRTDERAMARDPRGELATAAFGLEPEADDALAALDGGNDVPLWPNEKPPDLLPLTVAASQIADGLRSARAEAMLRQQEQVFMIDVDKRLVAWTSSDGLVPLDPALNIQLYTARSELIDGRKGRIRFFPDGSSTGGQIDLELAGDSAAVQIHWADGRVTVRR
jgi:hypothetical protein